MKDMVSWLADEESGQSLVKYALILALISIIVILVAHVICAPPEKPRRTPCQPAKWRS